MLGFLVRIILCIILDNARAGFLGGEYPALWIYLKSSYSNSDEYQMVMRYIKTKVGVFPVFDFVEFYDASLGRKSFHCDVLEKSEKGLIEFLIFWPHDIISFISEKEYKEAKKVSYVANLDEKSCKQLSPSPSYLSGGVDRNLENFRNEKGTAVLVNKNFNQIAKMNEAKEIKRIARLSSIEKQARAIMFQCNCLKKKNYIGLEACEAYASRIGLRISVYQFKLIRDKYNKVVE